MNMMEIIEALLLKNRTIVTSDFESCVSLIAKEIPLTIDRYPSEQEYGTWVVPPQWNVIKGVLSDGEKIIASYEEHPLFVVPYSSSFTGWVGREELIEHISWKQDVPDEYFYEHRLSMDYQRRLKEWRISIPYSLVSSLENPRYYVDIQVETKPGDMLVSRSTIKGKNDYTFALLSHLDHTGQANDGLAGVAVGIEVIKRIRQEFAHPEYNYELFVMPETIGSAVFLASHEHLINSYLGSIFVEMAGIRSPIDFSHTRRGNTYLDRVLIDVLKTKGTEFTEWSFGRPWGNDEKIFDSAGVGIPSASIGRHPFNFYHTSGDNLEATDASSLEEIVEVLMDAVRLIESDFVPRPVQKVPVYLTRFNLYADAVRERTQHFSNSAIIELLWSGMSVFDISRTIDVEYKQVLQYVEGFVSNGLVERVALDPLYFKRSLDSFGVDRDILGSRDASKPMQ